MFGTPHALEFDVPAFYLAQVSTNHASISGAQIARDIVRLVAIDEAIAKARFVAASTDCTVQPKVRTI